MFCAVYEKNSITAAARHLCLSQPTVSRHLRDFEAALGLSLFVLDRGQIAPTARADAIYADTAFLQSGIRRLESRIGRLQKGAGTRLALMSIGLLADWPLPQALAGLRADWPELSVSVDVGTSAQQLHLLRSGQLDIGLLGGRITDDSVQRTDIGSATLLAIVPRNHALAASQEVSLDDLARAEALSLSSRGPIARIVNEKLAEYRVEFSPRIVARSLAAVPGLVRALGRPAVIDEFTARSVKLGGLRILPIREPLRFDLFAVSSDLTGTELLIKQTLSGALKRLLAARERLEPVRSTAPGQGGSRSSCDER